MHLRTLVPLFVLGCSGTNGPGTDLDTSETGTPEPVATGRGSFVLELNNPWLAQGKPQTILGGVFVDRPSDVVNLGQCLFGADPWCASALPALGEQVIVDVPDPGLRTDLVTLDAGSSITVGPFTIPRTTDELFVSYLDSTDSLVSFEDPTLGLEAPGGDGWPATQLSSTTDIPTPMVVRSHDPSRSARFYDADAVSLRWLPGASGQVYLWMRTEQGETLRQLEDSGAYAFDLQPLGLSNESLIDLRLIRSHRAEGLTTDGGDVDFTVQYVERFGGVYYTIGERDNLTKDLSDSCDDALKADPVTAGFYEGSFATFLDDLDPGPTGCTGLSAAGADALVPVEVRPGQELTARYYLLENDASIYLLTDCNDVLTCEAGADDFAGANVGGEEVLHWTNRGSQTEVVYLALDGFSQVDSLFRLDIELSAIGGDVLENFCADAILQGPVGAGFYGGTLADHIDVLPAYNTAACKAPDQFGGEGIMEVYLQAGATMHLNADTPDGLAEVFLLSNCSVSASCFGTGKGKISWTNGSPYAQTFYVLLDSETGIGEYALDVEIE